MAAAVQHQTGVSVTRDGNKYTATWKNPSDMQAQEIRWRMIYRDAANGSDKFTNYGTEYPSKTTTKTTFTLSGVTIPEYFVGIQIQLRAKFTQNSGSSTTTTWSEWDAAGAAFTFNQPPQPTLSGEMDSDVSGRTNWTWESTTDNADHYLITGVQYQTLSLQNASSTPTESQWTSATVSNKALTGTQSQDDTILANGSVTRFVRVRANGANGYSAWNVKKVVFATPSKPQITNYSVSYEATNHYLNLSAEWTVPSSTQRPVDTTMLQYRIGKPTANMGMTNDGSWTDVGATGRPANNVVNLSDMLNGNTSSSSGTSSMSAALTETISADECVWIRAVARYSGGSDSPSDAVLAYIGVLAAPGTPAISNRNDSTHVVTITCTNNSAVPDSKLAIVYQPDGGEETIVAVFPHGTSSMSGIQCPNWDSVTTLGFRAFAYVGSESYTTVNGVKVYSINARMTSDASFTTGNIPKAPTVTLSKSPDEPNGIRVVWTWAWAEANYAEVSWSTRSNAWNSTAGPETHEVDATNGGTIDIGDLAAGQSYYVKVRLFVDDGEHVSYGPYGSAGPFYLSERPAKPVVSVSSDVVTAKDTDLTVSWTYVSMDGTDQIEAKIAELSSGIYTVIGWADTEQHAVIDTSKWTNGTQHQICVNVTSASNETSLWSDPVTVLKAEPPECTITQASLVAVDGIYYLQEMPMTVTVTGAGDAGTTTVSIVRASNYIQVRPDGTSVSGYQGETIIRKQYVGEAQQTLALKDILEDRDLDDTAQYRLIATVTDKYGQMAADAIDFTVGWAHQAVMPVGSVVIDNDIAKITIGTPVGTATGDTVDIYRLSSDRPVLIYKGADFGDVIVDPYPAIKGGYRLVFRTKNGDYTTAAMEFAWLDIDSNYNPVSQMIDFAGLRLLIKYNVELDDTSEKDFAKIKFLGGSTQGYWLEGANKSGSISGVLLTEEDVDDVEVFDRLMDYSGPARIRTKSGKSYIANVNTDGSSTYSNGAKIKTVSLTIDRVDEVGMDGVTLAEWSA